MKLRETIHDCESRRLAQRVAKLEEKLFGAMERISQLEEETAQLRKENIRLSKRPPDVLQQVEITATPTVVTEHQGLAYWCPHCQKFHYAPLPEAVVKAGLFGPRLTALVAFMKGVCHASFSTIRKFLRDVVLSRPTLYAVSHRQVAGLEGSDRGAGHGVQRRVGLRLLQRLPQVHARVRRAGAVLHGPPDPRFITTPGVEPTNNLAEQAIRFIVIDRGITQGTRSETGRRWCERIWTIIATCAQQGRSVFQFLLDSVQAYLCGTSPPSLLPSGP